MFRFKQFAINDDLCAMKVGTDGVLLGAWTEISDAQTILDVGTGSGLIALMLAQRSAAAIDALDVEAAACEQAKSNVAHAPFSNSFQIIHSDFTQYFPPFKYDLIVSNPPYFVDSLPSPNVSRTTARHTGNLNFTDLMAHSNHLLSEKGRLSLILPFDTLDTMQELAKNQGLFLTRKTIVRPTAESAPKRILLEYSRTKRPLQATELFLEQSRHVYSPDYTALTHDYYL